MMIWYGVGSLLIGLLLGYALRASDQPECAEWLLRVFEGGTLKIGGDREE